MDINPMSAVQVNPNCSASVFIDCLTRHAPVPHDRSIRPVRPITEDFSIIPAFVIGISSIASA